MLPFYNNYTEDGSWVKTAFFIPANIAFYREGYVDKRGVCDIKKATEYYLNERDKLAASPKALIDYKAEYCLFPSEAFALEGQNPFNKVKLVELISAIKFKKDYVPKVERGYMKFTFKDGGRKRENISGVLFIPHPQGPVYILQHPLWEVSSNIDIGETEEEAAERQKMDTAVLGKYNGLYVAGIDGIDIGQEQTSSETRNPSKHCVTIKRRIHGMKVPMYVAFYLDRPQRVEEAYEQTAALLYYYNAQANIEATRLGMLGWAKTERWMNYFMRRPRICSGDPSRKRTAAPYGTTASRAMIDHGIELVASYVEDYCENIWFIDMLELLLKYSDELKGKFDIIAAMQMCEIADEELSEIMPRAQLQEQIEHKDIGYYTDSRGYKRFGVIPKNKPMMVKGEIDTGYYEGYNITSNPRYR